jgi:hypothetical protein
VLGDDVNQGEYPESAEEPGIESGSPSELATSPLDQSQQWLIQSLIGREFADSEGSGDGNPIGNPVGTRGSLIATTCHHDEDRHGGTEQEACADSPGQPSRLATREEDTGSEENAAADEYGP